MNNYHNHINTVNELYVKLLLEKLYDIKFLKAESPDLYSKNEKIGCEVTSAFSDMSEIPHIKVNINGYIKYKNRFEHIRYKIENRIADDEVYKELNNIYLKLFNKNPKNKNSNEKIKEIEDKLDKIYQVHKSEISSGVKIGYIKDRIIDKMKKLVRYEQYEINCLYVIAEDTFIDRFELNKIISKIYQIRFDILGYFMENKEEYEEYDIIYLQLGNILLEWHYKINKIFLISNINGNCNFLEDIYKQAYSNLKEIGEDAFK